MKREEVRQRLINAVRLFECLPRPVNIALIVIGLPVLVAFLAVMGVGTGVGKIPGFFMATKQ